jgi:hypothetical protein
MGAYMFSVLVRIKGGSLLNRDIYFSPDHWKFGGSKPTDASFEVLTRASLTGL